MAEQQIKNPLERNTRITFRTNKELKEQATAILADLQIDLSTALNMFLAQVVKQDRLPFDFTLYNTFPNSDDEFTIKEPSADYRILAHHTGKKGMIIPNGVTLESHEYMTVLFLTEHGHTIELIPKSEISGVHTPDLIMDNDLKWEMKTPSGKSKSTISNQFRHASKQSQNLILDTRRMKRPNLQVIREATKQFELSKDIKRLWLITKEGKILDFKK